MKGKIKVSHTIEVDNVETRDYVIWAKKDGLFIEHKADQLALGIGENSVSIGIRARRPGHDHSNYVRITVENVIENSYPDPSARNVKMEYKPILIKIKGELGDETIIRVDEYGNVKISKSGGRVRNGGCKIREGL